VIPWRERELTLDMLVAGALLKYPLYFDWRLGLYTTPEAVVAQLAPRAARPLVAVRHSPARSLRKTRRWLRNVAMYFLTSLRDRLRSEAIYAPPPDAGASGHWRTDPPFFNDRDQSTK
jgi:capsular polysaccharide export protein